MITPKESMNSKTNWIIQKYTSTQLNYTKSHQPNNNQTHCHWIQTDQIISTKMTKTSAPIQLQKPKSSRNRHSLTRKFVQHNLLGACLSKFGQQIRRSSLFFLTLQLPTFTKILNSHRKTKWIKKNKREKIKIK